MRPAGSAIEVIEEQAQKANLPRLVRPAGSVIDVNEDCQHVLYMLCDIVPCIWESS